MLFNTQMLADRIRQLRQQRNLTQQELAEMTNLSDVYISSIECAKRIPALDTMLILCHALKCTPDELLEGFYPEKNNLEHSLIKMLCDRSTTREKQFMIRVCSAMVQILKDSL